MASSADVERRRIPVRELRPFEGNPRSISKDALATLKRSLQDDPTFMDARPLIVNSYPGRENVVIGGNMRLRAAAELGWKDVPAVVVSVPPDVERRWNLKDNNQWGQYEEEQLAEMLRTMKAEGAEIDALGFSDREIARLLAGTTGTYIGADDVGEPPAEPVTRAGDVIALGPHRLMCGDATDAAHVDTLVGSLPVECIVTDPPYAIYGSSTGVASDVADDKMVRPFFEALFRAAAARLEWFGHMYVCCDWRSWPAIWDSAKRGGLTPKNLLVWDKGGSGLGSNYANTYELIGFFHKIPEQATMARSRRAGIRSVLHPNVIRVARPSGDERQHNAAKPVELIAALIENSTEAGGRVLDLFGGSGSTLIAADATGRAGLVMEIEPKWCDVIVARYEKRTGAKAVRPERAKAVAK